MPKHLVLCTLLNLSGYQDSNLGPPAPKAGALTGLRYTPKALFFKSDAKVQHFFILTSIFLKKNRKMFLFSSKNHFLTPNEWVYKHYLLTLYVCFESDKQ